MKTFKEKYLNFLASLNNEDLNHIDWSDIKAEM